MSRQKKSRTKKIGLLLTMALVFTMVVSPATPAMTHSGTYDTHSHSWEGYFITSGDRIVVKTGNSSMGQVSQTENDKTLNSGDTWHFRAEPKSGYKFVNWTFENSNLVKITTSKDSQNLTISHKIDGSISAAFLAGLKFTATANFEPESYNVTLDLGAGGTFDGNGSSTIALTGPSGVEIVVPAYSLNPGYDLKGWSGSLKFDANKTLNANYEYSITFQGNEHITITGANPVWTVNHNVTAPSYSVDAGYRFDGWDRSLNNFTGPTTVTAKPAVKRGTLSLNKTGNGSLWNEGGVEGTYDAGTTVNLNNALPVAGGGWAFEGWRDDSTGQMLSGSTITIAGDCSYTAVFIDVEYLDTSAGDHGSLLNDLDGMYERGEQVNLNDAQPTGYAGYELDCWREFDGTQWEKYGGYGRVVDLVGGQPVITIGDQNIFRAFFKVANYSISYDLRGGTVSGNPTSYKYFDPEITLNNPTKTGYTFAGWEGTGLSGPTMTVKIPTHSSGDRSYIATWAANTYTVKYHANGGDGGATADSVHTYDTAAPLSLNGFTKTGCAFTGWATSPGGPVVYSDGQSVINLTDVNGATVNLYAKWRVSGVTVTGFDGVYDGIPHSVAVSGTLPGDTVTYSTDGVNYSSVKPFFTNATPAAGVTVYVRVQRAGAADFNDAKVVKIAKALLTVAADDKTTTYGITAPSFTASYSGFKGSDTKSVLGGAPSFACPYAKGDGAGSYTITVTQGTLGAANYDFTFNTGTLLVKKTTLTVTADNKTVPFGAPAPAYTATYSGFKGDDDESVLSGTLVFDCAYTAGSPVSGSPYTITPSGLSSGDYYIIYVPGALTVYSPGGGSRSSSASTPSPSPSPEVTPEPTPAPTQEPGESEPTPEPTLAPEELEDEEVPAGSADVKGGSSVWTSWWFWLVILAGVLLLLFLLLLMFKREKDKKEKEAKSR